MQRERDFHQIQLSKKSSHYLTITTPYDRFRYLKLPFGICSGTEIFQELFDTIYGDIQGVIEYVDDIVIYAKSAEEHNIILEKILKRARENNIKFNKNKCTINKEKVLFMGNYFSEKGIELDSERIQSILDIKSPKHKKELETFLGMITHVPKFIPDLAD